MVDISRRKALGITAGALGGAGLSACGSSADNEIIIEKQSPELPVSPVGASFEHGVASGDATQSAVIVWTRITPSADTTDQIPVRCVISTDPDKVLNAVADVDLSGHTQSQVVVTQTSAARDFTVKLDIGGKTGQSVKLDPGATYHYQFSVRVGDEIIYSPMGTTKTFPETGLEQLSLAVVSCSNYPFGRFNVYRALASRGDLDAVVHLGDYLYEYGVDGYGGSVGQAIGRNHSPITEIVTLDDYRARHAQYKADEDLQLAHAAAPWYCSWDDHESTNNSYRSGAENHNPEDNEGDWSERKQVAVQAYLEWMPVRDPEPGRAKESIYRSFKFGDLASLIVFESRLTGRSDEISWFAELGDVAPAQIPSKALATMGAVADPSRTMLGKTQEDWVADELSASVSRGETWQILGNQVIMAKVRAPNLRQTLTQEEIDAIPPGYVKQLVDFSQLGLPWNLDSWDGFPAARNRLTSSASEAGARLITLTGDTHTAWANELHNEEGALIGAEFGCTSVTSPGFGTYLPIERIGDLFAEANEEVVWHDPFGNGYTLVTLTRDAAIADFYKVSSVTEAEFTVEKVESFRTTPATTGVNSLEQI